MIVGGKGSFYLTLGYSLAMYVSGNYTTANHTLCIEAHFDFSWGLAPSEEKDMTGINLGLM